MAKQGKVLPARRPRGKESLLIRSAESIGRVIGTLQRQLDGPTSRETAKNGSTKASAHAPVRRASSTARKTTGGDGAAKRTTKSTRKKR